MIEITRCKQCKRRMLFVEVIKEGYFKDWSIWSCPVCLGSTTKTPPEDKVELIKQLKIDSQIGDLSEIISLAIKLQDSKTKNRIISAASEYRTQLRMEAMKDM